MSSPSVKSIVESPDPLEETQVNIELPRLLAQRSSSLCGHRTYDTVERTPGLPQRDAAQISMVCVVFASAVLTYVGTPLVDWARLAG